MTQYKLTGENWVIRTADSARIPTTDTAEYPNDNPDYMSYKEWLEAGGVPEPADPEAPASAFIRLQGVVQHKLDAWARQRGYDGILSLCTYATSTDPTFRSEGQRGVETRDACWAFGYALLAQVEAGTVPIPTDAELLAALPAMEWAV